MFPPFPGVTSNHFERITYAVSGVEVITSVRPNLDEEKVHLAVSEALSLWSAVTPLSFQLPWAGEAPLLRISFESDGQPSLGELGNTNGFVSSTPTGPTGGAGIHIDCDNLLFVDRFRESFPITVHGGPFDLIAVLAHEIGHGLGLDHPPNGETAMMSPSKGTAVVRQLYPYDIREVQKRHGAIQLAGAVSADLPATGRLIDASPGVQLQTAGPALVVSGPTESSTLLDALVPAKNSWANALHLEFTTITKNVYVNRLEAFDGIVPIEQFAISARSGDEGLTGKSWDLRFGFLSRPQLTNHMLVRLELYFTNKDGQPQSDFGVLQLAKVTAETLPPAIEPVPVE